VEFFINIHASIDHANDDNLIDSNDVKDEIQTDDKTPQALRKSRPFSCDEWKAGQIIEIGIDPVNESVGSIRAAFL